MPSQIQPRILIAAAHWSLTQHPDPENEWSLEQKLAAVKEAGFDAYTSPPTDGLKDLLQKHGLRWAGAFDAQSEDQFEERIRARLSIDTGPINCQLADHDTPPEEATQLTIQLMETAARLEADVHLEVHRDTCTETPEKTAAIIEGYRQATGKLPLVNFDFSHPASVKHLTPANYTERLFDSQTIETFQLSKLWHMRPFNGHHCQVPVTDGQGNFTPEYEGVRPFIRDAFDYWLAGPRPNNELWVVPELGPKKSGYGLSAFPNIWDDVVVLGKDLQKLWQEAVAKI